MSEEKSIKSSERPAPVDTDQEHWKFLKEVIRGYLVGGDHASTGHVKSLDMDDADDRLQLVRTGVALCEVLEKSNRCTKAEKLARQLDELNSSKRLHRRLTKILRRCQGARKLSRNPSGDRSKPTSSASTDPTKKAPSESSRASQQETKHRGYTTLTEETEPRLRMPGAPRESAPEDRKDGAAPSGDKLSPEPASAFKREDTLPGVNQSSLVVKSRGTIQEMDCRSIAGAIASLLTPLEAVEDEVWVRLFDADGMALAGFSVIRGNVVSPLYRDGTPFVDDIFVKQHGDYDFEQSPGLVLEQISLTTSRAMTFGELWARGITKILSAYVGETIYVEVDDRVRGSSIPLVLPFVDLMMLLVEMETQELSPDADPVAFLERHRGAIDEGWLCQRLPGECHELMPATIVGRQLQDLKAYMGMAKIATEIDHYLTRLQVVMPSWPLAMTISAAGENWHCFSDGRQLALILGDQDYFGRRLMELSRLIWQDPSDRDGND